MTRAAEFSGDVAGVLAFVLLVPIVILLVGTPVALGVRLLLAILGL